MYTLRVVIRITRCDALCVPAPLRSQLPCLSARANKPCASLAVVTEFPKRIQNPGDSSSAGTESMRMLPNNHETIRLIRKHGYRGSANEVCRRHGEGIASAPLRNVQLDELVVLKILKHCQESMPSLVTGQLLGL